MVRDQRKMLRRRLIFHQGLLRKLPTGDVLPRSACRPQRRNATSEYPARMFQKCAVDAAAEVMSQLHNSDAAVSTVITKGNESAPFLLLDRHLRHYRNSAAGCDHRQNDGDLAALKNDIRLRSRPCANRQDILPEAVALLEQEKRVALDLCRRMWPHDARRWFRGTTAYSRSRQSSWHGQ
jgi:hypothetical protein